MISREVSQKEMKLLYFTESTTFLSKEINYLNFEGPTKKETNKISIMTATKNPFNNFTNPLGKKKEKKVYMKGGKKEKIGVVKTRYRHGKSLMVDSSYS